MIMLILREGKLRHQSYQVVAGPVGFPFCLMAALCSVVGSGEFGGGGGVWVKMADGPGTGPPTWSLLMPGSDHWEVINVGGSSCHVPGLQV